MQLQSFCSSDGPHVQNNLILVKLRRLFTKETSFECLAGFWRCGVSAWLCHKAKSFTSQTAFDVMLTESFCRELGGDIECSCCGKNGRCFHDWALEHVWQGYYLVTCEGECMCRLCFARACSANQAEKRKKRSKKHFTETWSGTKSHKSSSAHRIPEPCRRHENSGSIQQEPFFPWHQMCTGIKWEVFFAIA